MAAHRRMVRNSEIRMKLQKTTEIRCAAAPPPGGHYAQAVLHRDTLYVSGQLGVTSETPDAENVGIAEQVTFALRNIAAIAGVVGANADDIIRCTVYVADIAHWDDANRAYAAFFGAHRPARSIVPCGPLHFGALIEIEAVVAVGN
ncbi:MAG: RidA family protein [Sphingosinicella sp.]|nr:RidA family protein [Sphingosinicella sp.]